MDASNEWYVQLLLADGNLPTGSFVASSGLESYIKHGFSSVATQSSSPDDMVGPTLTQATIDFIRDSLQNYAQTTLSFISGVHDILSEFRVGGTSREAAQDQVKYLDDLYESMTPNHVTRRASKAQGVALLTLYSKGFSKPSWSTLPSSEADGDGVDKILEGMKLMIRKGDSPGHLPICWALLTAALDLTKGNSILRT
jgi:urease accessory protein